jgi:hypothetical protein
MAPTLPCYITPVILAVLIFYEFQYRKDFLLNLNAEVVTEYLHAKFSDAFRPFDVQA